MALRDSLDLQMGADWRWGARCSYTSVKPDVHSLGTLKGRGDDRQLVASSSSLKKCYQAV